MNFPRSFVLFATLIVAVTISLSGCKSNTQPPAQNAQSADNSQPAAQQPAPQQPAAQPAAQQPAPQQPAPQPATPAQRASAAQPAQATQPAAPVAQPVAAAPAPAPAAAPAPPPPPPRPAVVTIPAGTTISVHTDSDMGSKISQTNQGFTATVANSVRVNGQIIIPRGARAEGVVVDAKPEGKFKGGAVFSIKLTRVRTKWGSYGISTATVDNTEKGKGKRTAAVTGGGAGLGAIIGGIAGGGKGLAIGALAGAGAGAAGSAFTGNKQIVVPAETLLTFQLDAPVRVHEVMSPDEDSPDLQQRPPQQ